VTETTTTDWDHTSHMFTMSTDDFSVHRQGCDTVDDGMPISDLPDEVESIDDLECQCWAAFDSLAEVE